MTLALCDCESEVEETELDQARAWAAERGRVLRELTAIGMGLARALARQVEAAMEPAEAGQGAPAAATVSLDPGLAFSRIARAVRLTVALEARQDEALRTLGDQVQAQRAEAVERRRREARAPIDRRRNEIRNRLEDDFEAEIDPEADDDECYDLWDGFNARLNEAAEAEDFLDRPFEDLVAAIRKDLGLPDEVLADGGLTSRAAARVLRPPDLRPRDLRPRDLRPQDLTPEDVAALWNDQMRQDRTLAAAIRPDPGGSG
jgi:hypothetical protein